MHAWGNRSLDMLLTRRLGAATVALAVGAGLALTMSPADAAAPQGTVTTITVQDFESANLAKAHYGDYISVDADVAATGGGDVLDGTVEIQTAPVGSSAWTTVASSDGFAYYSIDGLKQPIQFRAVYLGGPGYDAAYNDVTFAGSTSTTVAISKVGRGEALVKDTKKKVCYKVGPKPYKNKPVYHYYRIGKKKAWHRSYTEHTNKKSEICWKPVKLKHVKHIKKTKGPKITAEKTVYVKSGGMKKTTVIDKF